MKEPGITAPSIGQRVRLQHLSGWEGRTGWVRSHRETDDFLLVEVDYEPRLDAEHRQSWKLWTPPAAVAAV